MHERSRIQRGVIAAMARRVRGVRGFTLLELMVTLAVASIIASVAAPSFDRMLTQNRLAVATNELQGALLTARQTAIARSAHVTFCAGSQMNGCHGRWQNGEWIVFVDRDHDAVIDADDTLVLTGQAPRSAAISVSGNGPFKKAVVFRSTGMAETVTGAFAAGTLRVCASNLKPDNANDLVLIGSGRAVLQARDFDGTCPLPGR